MILLLEPDQLIMASVKLVLLWFDAMYGLKLNFHKFGVIAIGSGRGEGTTTEICTP